MYILRVETKYGHSYWNNKNKDFGTVYLATVCKDYDEASLISCNVQSYQFKYYQNKWLEIIKVNHGY
jgi:hypothetical protein